MTTIVLGGIPNPVDVVTDAVGGAARGATGSIFEGLGSFVVSWLGDACRDIGRELVSILSGPAQVDFSQGWWAGPRGRALAADIGALAVALTLAFLLLAVLHGVLAGDPGAMLRTVVTHLPLSILGMVTIVAGTEILLGVTDEATHLVLGDTPANLGRFVEGLTTTAALPVGSLAVALLLVVFLVGAFLVWVELAVRSALVYLLVAFAPLVLAARIWPAARGVFRRLVELGVAVIVSKFVIGVTLAMGSAALAGGGPTEGGATGHSLTLAGLLGGATLMGLAAFTPFVVLRLLPVVETAVAAHGIAASPVRGAQAAVAAGSLPTRVSGMVATGRVAGAANIAGPVAGAAAGGGLAGRALSPVPGDRGTAERQRPAGGNPSGSHASQSANDPTPFAHQPRASSGPVPRNGDATHDARRDPRSGPHSRGND